MFIEQQVLFLDDWQGRIPELIEMLKQTFAQLRRSSGNAFKFSLCIFDDVTAEMNDGSLNLLDLFTTGRHMRTDVWAIFHSTPAFSSGGAPILRQNATAVIAFGLPIASRLCSIPEFVYSGNSKEAEIYMKSFINNESHIGVFLEVNKGGEVRDYIHPFQAGKLEESSFVGFPVINPTWVSISPQPVPSAPPAPRSGRSKSRSKRRVNRPVPVQDEAEEAPEAPKGGEE